LFQVKPSSSSCFKSSQALQVGAFVYDSAKKQMLNAISLIIEQRKNKFNRIAKVRFFPIYIYALIQVKPRSAGWFKSIQALQVVSSQAKLFKLFQVKPSSAGYFKSGQALHVVSRLRSFVYLQPDSNLFQSQ
jgi:hypothetical protein